MVNIFKCRYIKINLLFIVISLFLVGCEKKNDKVTISRELQEYLFYSQDILEKYISIQDEFFSPLKDTTDYRDYKSFNNQLSLLNKKLTNKKDTFLKTMNNYTSKREMELIELFNVYVDKLNITIFHLSSISRKLSVDSFYTYNEYPNDIDRFFNLRDDYLKLGEEVNTLLENILITPPIKIHN